MRFFSFLLSVFIFTGCVSKQDFPSSWEKIDTNKSTECSNIVGVYQNKGQIESSEYSPLLSEYLFTDIEKSDFIEISKNNDTFYMKAYLEENLISEKSFDINSKSISCKDGFWLIHKDKSHNDGGVLAKEWDSFNLTKNKDGLIIKKVNNALGLFFLIPVIGHDTSWVLFKNK
ncbi:hypothetical protein [Poseidonibacter lekithochrous]|uniref:hypothetical protein n=1 Tax=Poseidonibacter lekithochrous TaxID=1904463 RepID=UPI000D378A58|nr:hypothetical protein [Poseidonibacter lekithochrous]